jgi:hypothetical protein
VSHFVLCLNRCPHGVESISLDCHGDIGRSTRLTTLKCCGRWNAVKEWNVTNLADVARDFAEAAEIEEQGGVE